MIKQLNKVIQSLQFRFEFSPRWLDFLYAWLLYDGWRGRNIWRTSGWDNIDSRAVDSDSTGKVSAITGTSGSVEVDVNLFFAFLIALSFGFNDSLENSLSSLLLLESSSEFENTISITKEIKQSKFNGLNICFSNLIHNFDTYLHQGGMIIRYRFHRLEISTEIGPTQIYLQAASCDFQSSYDSVDFLYKFHLYA